MLANIGYRDVSISTNGKEAVNSYKTSTEKPEIIIMDYRMPVMNGIDAMIKILHINIRIKIIFASADLAVKERAISLGAIAFLHKPFDMFELMKLIKNIIIIEN